MRLISVVMGAKSANARANENQNLLNYGFRFFESHRLYEAQKTLSDARVWKGNEQTLALGVFEDMYVTIPRRHYNDLKAEINVDKKIIAPIKIGQKLGSITVKIKNDIIVEKELVALTAIEQGNIARRLYDGAMMMLEKSDAGK
jgi:D-alanyl-D-alanine carboxypeptidase (penicillin-binding protein 5/6)